VEPGDPRTSILVAQATDAPKTCCRSADGKENRDQLGLAGRQQPTRNSPTACLFRGNPAPSTVSTVATTSQPSDLAYLVGHGGTRLGAQFGYQVGLALRY